MPPGGSVPCFAPAVRSIPEIRAVADQAEPSLRAPSPPACAHSAKSDHPFRSSRSLSGGGREAADLRACSPPVGHLVSLAASSPSWRPWSAIAQTPRGPQAFPGDRSPVLAALRRPVSGLRADQEARCPPAGHRRLWGRAGTVRSRAPSKPLADLGVRGEDRPPGWVGQRRECGSVIHESLRDSVGVEVLGHVVDNDCGDATKEILRGIARSHRRGWTTGPSPSVPRATGERSPMEQLSACFTSPRGIAWCSFLDRGVTSGSIVVSAWISPWSR